MNAKKTFTTAFVLLLMTAAALAGCGSKDGGDTSSEGSTATKSGDKTQEMVGNMYKTGLPIVQDKVTLKFASTKAAQQKKPHEDLQVVKNFEEKTNVNIEWDVTSQGYGEKKNLMFASGDLPDVFFGSESLSDSDLVTYGSQGMLIPLEELIDKYAPNIKSILEKRPDIKKSITAPDGHIYSIPSIQEDERSELSDVLFINKKWLDQLGLPLPATTDEFEKALKAFKDNDMNGNGKKDEIPFSFVFGHNIMGIYSMYGSFGQIDNAAHITVDDSGKVAFTADKESFKQATNYFHRLYSQGLIDPEAFTQDRTVLFSKGKNKDVEILGAYVGWNQNNVVGPDRAKDYVPLPPLKGPNGTQLWTKYEPGFMSRSGFAITSSNKYPEISIRWIDELVSEKNSLEWNWGPIGIGLKEIGDGKYEFMQKEGMSADDLRHSEAPGNTSARIVLKDTLQKIKPSEQDLVRQSFLEIHKPFFNKTIYPNVIFPLEDTQKLSILQTDILDHVKKSQSQWIINGNIDAEWDKYIAQLKKMGLDELVGIYQKNYDRYQSGK